MNYNEIVNNLVSDFKNPCDQEVGPGQYRRVMWEKYNPNAEYIQPKNQEEWDTEIIDRKKRVFNKSPFNEISEQFPAPNIETGAVAPGIWVKKLGIYFSSQSDIESYVKSIGSTLLDGNNWYGADLSKKHLFKTSFEENMYLIENAGGIWTKAGPKIDSRSMLYVKADYNLYINYNGLKEYRVAYIKHYDNKPCTYTGLEINLNVDLNVPGLPVAAPAAISELPDINFRSVISCVPFSAKFPYNGLTNAILESWNTSKKSFKLYWDMLPGLTSKSEGIFSTAYNHLSVAMEELGNASVAMCQYVQQAAWLEFKNIISNALNIVGGGWNVLKSFLPKISILGISIDIEDLCTSEDGVQKLRDQLSSKYKDIKTQISSIYSVIGSSYDYSVERVKMSSRDIVDALTDLYDWCWSKLLMGGMALCKFLVDIAQIWSMPPEVPNPVWSVVTAVKEMMSKIKPLDMIMSGNFPGFTASDIYQLVIKNVNDIKDKAYAEIKSYKEQSINMWNDIKIKTQEYKKQVIEFKQYLSGMAENVSDELTREKEKALNSLKTNLDILNNKYNSIKSAILSKQFSVKDTLTMALNEFKKLPIIQNIEELLGLVGTNLEDMMKTYENSVTKCKSLYHQYTDGSRSIKDLIKSLYNQISTLALSKTTQWINKLLSIFGLEIIFPSINICVPCLMAPK